MENLIVTIDTTRCSTVIAAFTERYPDAIAVLDQRVQTGATSEWCTTDTLLDIANFSLRDGVHEVLVFKGSPQNLWASFEALELVEELAEKKILGFKVEAPQPPSLLSRLLGPSDAG